jgi:hypothetical protein
VIEFYKRGDTLSISEVSFEGKNFNEKKEPFIYTWNLFTTSLCSLELA